MVFRFITCVDLPQVGFVRSQERTMCGCKDAAATRFFRKSQKLFRHVTCPWNACSTFSSFVATRYTSASLRNEMPRAVGGSAVSSSLGFFAMSSWNNRSASFLSFDSFVC